MGSATVCPSSVLALMRPHFFLPVGVRPYFSRLLRYAAGATFLPNSSLLAIGWSMRRTL